MLETARAEEFFRSLFQKGADALYLVEGDELRIVEANEELGRLLGYAREELLALRLPDLVPPEHRALIPDLRASITADRPVERTRWLLLRKDGASVLVDHQITRIDLGGRVTYLASARDITEQIRTEEALRQAHAELERRVDERTAEHRESQERYELVARASNTGIWDWDLKTGRVTLSPLWKAQLGFEDGELPDEFDSWASRLHPEERDRIISNHNAFIEGASTEFQHEFRLRHKDGSYRWIHADVAILRDGSGKAVRALGTHLDVTESRRAEEALRESEERFRAAFAHMGIGMCLTGSDGRLLQVNRSLCEMLGYTESDLVGTSFQKLTHPEDRAKSGDALRRLLAGEVSHARFEKRYVHRDGRPVWVQLSTSMIRDGAGRPAYFVTGMQDISAAKQAEDELRQAQAHLERRVEERTQELSLVLAHTRDFVYRHDAEGVFTYLSPSVAQITGYSVQDWLAHYTKYLTDNPINQKVIEYTEETLRTGRESPPYLVEIRHKDGRRILLEVNESAYREGGRVAGVVGVARDVTESKKAEEALRLITEGTSAVTGEDFFVSLVRHLALGLEVKAALVAECFGRPPDRVRTLALWAGEAIAPNLEFGLPGTPCDGVLKGQICAYPRGVRERFPGVPALDALAAESYLGVPMQDASGEVMGHLAVLDVRPMEDLDRKTAILRIFAARAGADFERQRAEKALRFQKTLLESQSEAAIDGILVVSLEGKMISFNRRFVEMWDIPPQVVESRSDEAAIRSVLDTLSDPDAFQARVKYLYDHPDQESRDEIALKDGRIIDRYGAPIRSLDGMRYGRVWFFRDVTGRKKTELELRRAADETRLAYEDLKQAQAQLIRSEKLASIGMLVSGVAHEINNPLNVMYGNLQLLAADPDLGAKGASARGRRLRSMIRDALKAAQHARRIVEDFRSYARDTRTAEPVDLNVCLEETLAIFRSSLRPGVRLVKRLSPLPSVRCFRGQMNQVFLNLLKNADEAIERRGTITLRTRRKSGRVVVEVADTGRGMPEEVRRKLFEPFFTTKPVGKGLGLGLSISAMIVHNHGGEIDVKSLPGRGAVFRVELPATCHKSARP